MYCTRCGTQNAATALTCKECEAALRPAPGPGTPQGRRCGMCATVNSPDAIFCAQCGARVQMIGDGDPLVGDDPASPYSRDDPYGDPYRRDAPASGAAWGREPERPAAPGGSLGWLGSLRDPEAAAPADPEPEYPELSAAAPPPAGSWFDRLRSGDSPSSGDSPGPSPAGDRQAAAPGPAGDSWLASLRAPGGRDTPAAADTAAVEDDAALPTWVLSNPDPDPSAGSSRPASPPATGQPAWFDRVRAPGEATSTGLPAWMNDPAPAEDEGPAWLAALRPTEPSAPPATPPAPTPSALPSWLEDIDAPASTAAPALPSWLADLDAPAAAPAPEPPAAPVPHGPDLTGGIELPAWLQAAGSAPPPPPLTGPKPFTGALALPEERTPEDTEDTAPPMAVPATPISGELTLPAWMDTAGGAAVPAPDLAPLPDTATPVPTSPPPSEEASGPGLDLAYTAPTVPDSATPRTGRTGILFPTWLEDNSADAETEEEATGDEDMPAWLRALQPSPPPVVPTVPTPAPVAASEDLPDWLQALAGGATADDEAPAPVEDALLPMAGPVTRTLQARPPRAGSVETFTRLLTPPEPRATPVVVPSRAARMLAWLLPNGLVYLLLLAVTIGMWLAARPLAPDPALARATGDALAFHQLLIGANGGRTGGPGGAGGQAAPALAPGGQITPTGGLTGTGAITATGVLSPVLVVFDWDAGRYGEMHELSRAILRDLMSRGRPFTTVSLLPQGPGFADQVVGEIGEELKQDWLSDSRTVPTSLYGKSYVNLGYRPGNEAAIRRLVTAAGGVNAVRDLDPPYDYKYQLQLDRWALTIRAPSLRDYGLVVLLTGEEASLRLWIEQLASQTTVPVVAAVPMSLRPMLAAYRDPALAGLTPARIQQALVGVQDAYALEQARLGTPAGRTPSADQVRLSRLLHAQAAGLFAVAVVLLLGFFAGLYGWLNRPRRT